MKPIIFSLLIFFTFPPLAIAASYKIALVKRVIDGDTLHLTNDKRIRLIGIDTPEKHPSQKLTRLSKQIGEPIKSIQNLGERASKAMEYIMQSASSAVLLEYDVEYKDKYGRDLAYVYVPYFKEPEGPFKDFVITFKGRNWLMVNALMVRQGFAQAYFIPPNMKHQKLFRRLEKMAKVDKNGFWGDPLFDKMLKELEKKQSKYQ